MASTPVQPQFIASTGNRSLSNAPLIENPDLIRLLCLIGKAGKTYSHIWVLRPKHSYRDPVSDCWGAKWLSFLAREVRKEQVNPLCMPLSHPFYSFIIPHAHQYLDAPLTHISYPLNPRFLITRGPHKTHTYLLYRASFTIHLLPAYLSNITYPFPKYPSNSLFIPLSSLLIFIPISMCILITRLLYPHTHHHFSSLHPTFHFSTTHHRTRSLYLRMATSTIISTSPHAVHPLTRSLSSFPHAWKPHANPTILPLHFSSYPTFSL